MNCSDDASFSGALASSLEILLKNSVWLSRSSISGMVCLPTVIHFKIDHTLCVEELALFMPPRLESVLPLALHLVLCMCYRQLT